MGKHTLGELQHAIMQVLWARTEATVAEVHRALQDDRGLAPTTIATMLRKMEDKGVVAHRVEDRHFVYRPTVSEDEVRLTMVSELLDRLFAGDPAALVSHLVVDHDMDEAEIEKLRSLLDGLDAGNGEDR
jgi:predicted transcriptional regulator